MRWIEGLGPCHNEMMFERSSPSCYSPKAFAASVNQSRGGIVMAGFAGEQSCLSTLIDAFHHNHEGHLSVRRYGGSCSRRDAGGRSPPRSFENIRS
jgi:hypothetical protein